ncbi:hypothetical protein [Sinobaca sp. H24]|nr:hypothetical protein [Sinobaca sp. H24]
MTQLNGTLITLTEPTESDIKALYFWKYEEKKQEAKKWNAPYIQ